MSSVAHVSGGPSVGLKNFASPGVTLVHHAHHAHHLGAAPGATGHHNLAMDGSTTSSQSSSLGGVAGAGAGGDPLLRGRHHAHLHQHHAHHHHHHAHLAHRLRPGEHDELDDELDEDVHGQDQGVLSSDEANYRADGQDGEGFRDTNELTINADTVVNGAAGPANSRHRLYSANSMSRSMATNRLSMGNLSVSNHHHHHAQHHAPAQASSAKHHQHHHHSHHHLSSGSAASSQHQRLVSSSTPSASTRSSQASPPSDDHSLEQLAYGNNWHPSVTGAPVQVGHASQTDANSNTNSAASGASILGNNGRAGAGSRYS